MIGRRTSASRTCADTTGRSASSRSTQAVPGHYLQSVYANPTEPAAENIFSSRVHEGWAVYAQVDDGCREPTTRSLTHWKLYLRSTTNA